MLIDSLKSLVHFLIEKFQHLNDFFKNTGYCSRWQFLNFTLVLNHLHVLNQIIYFLLYHHRLYITILILQWKFCDWLRGTHYQIFQVIQDGLFIFILFKTAVCYNGLFITELTNSRTICCLSVNVVFWKWRKSILFFYFLNLRRVFATKLLWNKIFKFGTLRLSHKVSFTTSTPFIHSHL